LVGNHLLYHKLREVLSWHLERYEHLEKVLIELSYMYAVKHLILNPFYHTMEQCFQNSCLIILLLTRSEERRVGKECIRRWRPRDQKKKYDDQNVHSS